MRLHHKLEASNFTENGAGKNTSSLIGNFPEQEVCRKRFDRCCNLVLRNPARRNCCFIVFVSAADPSTFRLAWLYGCSRRNDDLQSSLQDDPAVHEERPVLQIMNVTLNTLDDIRARPGFTAESAHLGETGDARLHISAHGVIRQRVREILVVLEQMRARPDHAHFAAQDVDKLRQFINA